METISDIAKEAIAIEPKSFGIIKSEKSVKSVVNKEFQSHEETVETKEIYLRVLGGCAAGQDT